jgi:NDP-sugar pyrophosphorylase family protein
VRQNTIIAKRQGPWLEMKLNLVIPAAGLGSRFRAIGIDTPKPLIPVLDIPMIGWVIANFPLNVEDEIWIITRKEDHIPKQMESVISKIINQIHFIEIDELTDGAATTLQFALDQIPGNEAVLSANSDQFISTDITEFIESVRNGISEGQILTMYATDSKWSYIERDSNQEVINVVEKVVVSDEATVGVYGWKSVTVAKNAIAAMKKNGLKVNGEFYVAPSYTYLLKQGGKISTFNVGDVETDVHGLGTPEDLKLFLLNSNIDAFHALVSRNLGDRA